MKNLLNHLVYSKLYTSFDCKFSPCLMTFTLRSCPAQSIRQSLLQQRELVASLSDSEFRVAVANHQLRHGVDRTAQQLEAAGVAFRAEQRLFLRPELVTEAVAKTLEAHANGSAKSEVISSDEMAEVQRAAERKGRHATW